MFEWVQLFVQTLIKKKFSKFFPDLLKQKYVPGITGITRRTSSSFQPSDNFREQYESMCKNKSFGTMVYIKFRSSAPPVVSEPEPEPEPEPELTRDLKNAVLAKDPVAFEEAMDRKMEEDEIKMEQENDEIINGNVDESSSPGSGSGSGSRSGSETTCGAELLNFIYTIVPKDLFLQIDSYCSRKGSLG